MSERSIYSSILSAELARWHEETEQLVVLVAVGATLEELMPQIKRIVGLLPDDIRPKGIKPTPFVQRSKKTEVDDLL